MKTEIVLELGLPVPQLVNISGVTFIKVAWNGSRYSRMALVKFVENSL